MIFAVQIVFTLFSIVLGILLLLWGRKPIKVPQKSNLGSGSIRNFLFNVGLTLTFVIPLLMLFFVLIKGDGSWLSVVFDNFPSYVCFIGIILIIIALIQLLVATIRGVTKEKQQRIAIVRTLVFASC